MRKGPRRNHAPAFAKAALMAERTPAELAQRFDVRPSQTTPRKSQLLVEEQDQGPEQAMSMPCPVLETTLPSTLLSRTDRMLCSAGPLQDGRHGPGQDHDVPPERPMFDIPCVELNPPPIGRAAAPVDLPQTGQARSGRVVASDVLPVALDLAVHDWTRPHEAHLKTQDIEELGQLVQAHPSQEGTNRGDAWIMAQLPCRPSFGGGGRIGPEQMLQHRGAVLPHRAEFEAAEPALARTHPRMGVKHRAAIKLDQNRDRRQQRRQDQEQAHGTGQVQQELRCSGQKLRRGLSAERDRVWRRAVRIGGGSHYSDLSASVCRTQRH